MSLLNSIKNLTRKDHKPHDEKGRKGSESAKLKESKKKEDIKEVKSSFREDMGGVGLALLRGPHFSEKASYLAEDNKYVFKVFSGANKIQVKNAVEKVYEVKVADVNTINVQKKKRMVRQRKGWKKGYRKAIITLKKGYRIEA